MRRIALSAAVGLGIVLPVASASAQVISEVRIAQPGVDNDQYIELAGDPGTVLDGMKILVVGDLEGVFPPQQNGGVETVVNLSGTIPASGTFLVANSTYTLGTPDQIANLVFEQGDNLTIILASQFSGSVSSDIDANDDGVIDPKIVTVVDSVAILAEAAPDGFSSDFYYSDNTVGPIAGFPPLHSWRCSDTLVWRPGQDALGGANETPGEINASCDNGGGGGGLEGVYLSELRWEQSGPDNDEFFEIGAEPGQSLDGLTYVVIGDGSAALGSGVIEEVISLDGNVANANGFFVVADVNFTLGIADLLLPLNHEGSDNVTIFLVTDFTGANGDDLDLDDDGILDITPWTEIVDEVALIETCDVPPTSTEWVYSSTTVGPDGVYLPGGAYRCFPSAEWVMAPFADLSVHTPGSENIACEGGGCGGLDRSCFVAHAGPGCSDTVICGLVCDVDPGCCSTEWDSNCASIAGAYLVAGDAPAVNLSEIRGKQRSTDSDEYVEIAGDPGQALDGISIIAIGRDACSGDSVVIHQFNLYGQTIPSSGLFVMGDPSLSVGTAAPDYPLDIEILDGGNQTFALAWNFTGAIGQTVDVDGDCTLDETPWESLAGEVVAFTGDAAGNCVYLGAIEVGPDDIYSPGHIYKCSTGEWSFSNFDVALGADSPGLPNPECGAPPTICGDPLNGSCFEVGTAGCDDAVCCDRVTTLDPFCGTNSWDETCVALAIDQCMPLGTAPSVAFAEIRVDQPGADVDEYIEVVAAPGTSLEGVSVVVLGDGAGGVGGTVETVLAFGSTTTDGNGLAVLGNASLTLGSPAYPGRFNLENGQNSTFLLVHGFTGNVADDLDTDDDGILDVTPWSSVIDSVSIIQTTDVPAAGVFYYGAVVVGPEETVDGLTYMPGQVWACSDSGDWNIGVYDPASVDPAPTDTAGAVNPECGGVVCEGDFNGDGQVNGADFGAMLAAWGPCSGCAEDLNDDGVVSGADVGLLLSVWGACP